MKRFLCLFITLLFAATMLVGCGAKPADYTDASFDVSEIDTAAETQNLVGDLKEFVYGDRGAIVTETLTASAKILNRTAFSRSDGESVVQQEGELAAAGRIKTILTRAGYADGDADESARSGAACYTQTFALKQQQRQGMFQIVEKELHSQNVIASVPARLPKKGKVLLVTHYDNSYGTELLPGSGTHGVYESGIATAAVMRAAQRLKDAELAYDLEFVFFGASVPGGYGSAHYVEKMSVSDADDIRLVVDFDLLGCGDYDYLFCDDVATDHEEYLRAAATATGAAFQRAPDDKKAFVTSDKSQYYRHAGWMSDHYLFYKKGLNTAAVFGMNWSDSDTYGVYESAAHPGVLMTSADTLYTVDSYYPDYADRAVRAVEAFVTAISGDRFDDAMTTSRKNRANLSWLQGTTIPAAVYIGAVVLLLVLVSVLGVAIAKKNPPPAAAAPPPPAPEDIFGESGSAKDDGNTFGPPPDNASADPKQEPFGSDGDNPFQGY